MLPTLDENERRILQVIDEEGVIRGSVLRRRARIDDADKMRKSVRNLLNQRFIAVAGSVADERSVQEAHFSPVPSTRGLLKEAVAKG